MNIPIQGQIEGFFQILVFLLFIQVATTLIFRPLLGKFSTSLSFPLSLLLFSVCSMYGTFFHIPPPLFLIPFAVAIAYTYYRSGDTCFRACFDDIRVYLIYILTFCFISLVSSYTMIIFTGENVTDFAIMISFLHDPAIPPLDVWLGGAPLDVYYYLSHVLFGAVSRVTGISPDLLFTLAIPAVFSATVMGLYSLSECILEKYRYLPLLIILVPNTAFILYVLSGKGLYDALQLSIRVIPGTNNEYPYYSFLMSVFHAHSVSLFNQVLFLTIMVLFLVQWKNISGMLRLGLAGIAALSFGAMFPFNTWEVAIFGPGLFLAGYWIFRLQSEDDWTRGVPGLPMKIRIITFFESNRYSSLVLFWICIPVLSILMFLPYHLNQHTVSYGIDLVKTPSDPTWFLLIFGLVFLVLLYDISDIIRKKPVFLVIPVISAIPGYLALGLILMFLLYYLLRREGICDYLAILGLWALLLPELIVYADRMNTVFKFHYCVYIILGFVCWAIISRFLQDCTWLQNRGPGTESGIQALLISLAAIMMLIIAVSVGHAPSLDATLTTVPHFGGDIDAISFLRTLPGDHVLIELSSREKGNYFPYGRISSLSGVPAAVGWWLHEIQWRQMDPAQMSLQVSMNNAAYEDPDNTLRSMDTLGADLLYVGTLEKQKYPSINLPTEGLDKIFEKNGVYIFERNKSLQNPAG